MPARLPVLGAIAVTFALVLTFAPAVGAAGGTAGPDPIYRNNSYSFAERAADLVARMTLAEKSSQMSATRAPAIPRLGIHPWGWWNEANHGVAFVQLYPPYYINQLVNTTTYPVDLALGSSWDPSLMYDEATQIGDEARDVTPQNSLNLDFFTPTVNLSRDPRWGRNDETFSEDPLLGAKMGSQFVDGLQGQTPDGRLLAEGGGYLKTIATLKHYAANNSENNRMTGSSNMDARTLREYYTSQFGQIVQASHPGAIMSSYNEVNGTPASADPFLIDTLARQTFGFGGYFTSDCDSIDDIEYGHSWRPPGYVRLPTATEIRAVANAAGEDLDCNLPYTTYTYRNTLAAATAEGIRTPSGAYTANNMDTSLVRLFTARMETGEWGNINNEPWVKQARSELGGIQWPNLNSNNAITETPTRLGLDQSVADRTQVLLKNAPVTHAGGAAPVLPLGVPTSGPFKVAVYGFFGNQQSPYLGDYSSFQSGAGLGRVVNDYAGIKSEIQSIDPQAQVDYYSGFTGGDSAATLTNIDQNAVGAASGYNDVIAVVGTDYSTAHENLDRASLDLPGAQVQLINELAARNPNTVAVLRTVGDVNVGAFEPNVPAILWSSFNGQREGLALADVLLGHYSPSGHLPFTWYASDSELPSIDDYRIRPGRGTRGRTYMYFNGPVSYPFGYGLSYTTFVTSSLRFNKTHLTPNDTLDALVTVTNTGKVYGEDLVQLYVTKSGAGNPIKRLEGFQQVTLAPGQTTTVKIPVKILKLAFWKGGHYTVEPGLYGIQIGSSANAVLKSGYVAVGGQLITTPATVTASPTMPGDRSRGIRQRVMFPAGTTINPNLVVATNDGSLYGYGHGAPLPKAMRLTYSSNRPKVISVAKGGTITTVANGVATITVKVVYHGATAYGTFVVRVLSEVNAITLQAKAKPSKRKQNKSTTTSPAIPLPGFEPDIYSYDVVVPYGVRLPRIAATTADKRAHVHVGQVGRVPGVAHIRITGPDGLTQTYSLYFARPALRDSFSAANVGPQWTWIRQDAVNEVVSGGALEITTQQGDLGGDTRPGTNLLVQPALGDWTISTRMTLSNQPAIPGQQAGIIAYQDDQNYLKLDWENSGGSAELVETTEDNLSGSPVSQILATYPTGRVRNTVWLRIVKRGPHYTTYFSRNGRSWLPIYTVGASLQDVQVGLFAWNGPATGPTLRASFGYFHVNNTGPVNLGSLH